MRKPDLSLQYLGSPCHKGHSGWRYRKGGRCVECAQILSRDRSALRNDALADSRPQRRDEFKATIERAAAHMYAAGLELWQAKDMRMHGLRQELAKHGLTQRTAAELRRYAYRKDTGEEWVGRRKLKKSVDSVQDEAPGDWLRINTDPIDSKL